MIKEQLKQENQRKLFDKSFFMTVRPEFNNDGATQAVAMVLFKFSQFFRWFGGFVPVFRWFRCFVPVFRWFRSGVSAVPVVLVVSFQWFRSGGFGPVVSGFSTCHLTRLGGH